MMRFARGGGSETGLDRVTALLVSARTDPTAFAAFYRMLSDDIFRYARRSVICPEIAADITAESFASALRHVRQFDPARGSGAQWMYGIARNQIRMWARRGEVDERARQKLRITTPTLDESDIAMIEDRHDAGPLVAAVREVLASLSDTDRDIIELRVLKCLPYDQIATELEVTPTAARVRCSRALARLRRELELRLPDLEERLA
jgi:RNA polymerase sigma-70 factor (ECF subfamily)